MALGTGSFTEQNKILPGIYIKASNLSNQLGVNDYSDYRYPILGFAVIGSMVLGESTV